MTAESPGNPDGAGSPRLHHCPSGAEPAAPSGQRANGQTNVSSGQRGLDTGRLFSCLSRPRNFPAPSALSHIVLIPGNKFRAFGN